MKFKELFTPTSENLVTKESFQAEALETLRDAFALLAEQFPELDDKYGAIFEQGLSRWQKDPSHNIEHSFWVYQKMLHIAYEEGVQLNEQVQRELFIRAILHDLGEFFTIYGKDVDHAQRHPLVMAVIIRGINMLLKANEGKQLSVDILNHDFFWEKPSVSQMEQKRKELSVYGHILADADRLVDNGATSVEEEVQQSLQRNRDGSLGKWYVLRQDLTAEDRAQWQMRTKGLFDGLSALLPEFTGSKEWFYTRTGQALHENKLSAFRATIIEFYQQRYDYGWQQLDRLKGQEIRVGIKGEAESSEVRIPQEGREMRELLTDIVETPINSKIDARFPERKYHGYSLQLDNNEWIDPSILVFENKEALAQYIDNAISEYENLTQAQIER